VDDGLTDVENIGAVLRENTGDSAGHARPVITGYTDKHDFFHCKPKVI